jgi:thymidylate synthase (FAD)|tara:strand:- start:10340 stop:11026 length:687 start_codon:yes stop_codon:yes gene_type:complete
MKSNVNLISYTQSGGFLQGLDDLEGLVAYCARVSNPSNQNNAETATKLIKYLIKHKHWSPLEMVNACLEIETTRDIARQILRHRSFSFQEFSQRYADPTKDLEFVTREARLQDEKNRQNSIEMADDNEVINEFYAVQSEVIRVAKDAYEWAIRNSIAKEQARAVLPEGLTMSRMYMNGTLRSWVHYIELRTDPSTQKEHREIAQKCALEIAKVFPLMDDILREGNDNE